MELLMNIGWVITVSCLIATLRDINRMLGD